MKFRISRPLLQQPLVALGLAISLYGCGAGGGDSQESTPPPPQPQASFVLSSEEGGYVIDDDRKLYCEHDNQFCEKEAASGDLESLTAVARFGYAFSQWRRNGAVEPATGAELQFITEAHENISASFQKLDAAVIPSCISTGNMHTWRSLHLGDSLTANQCGGNCPTILNDFNVEPTRESVRFYAMWRITAADSGCDEGIH